MAGEAIQLAKHVDYEKLEERVMASLKLDGVPVRIDALYESGRWKRLQQVSRQNHHLHSIEDNVDALMLRLNHNVGGMEGYMMSFVGEVMHESLSGFKDISGVVRRNGPQSGLRVNMFDFQFTPDKRFPDQRGFEVWHRHLRDVIGSGGLVYSRYYGVIPQTSLYKGDVQQWLDEQRALNPTAEGFILRNVSDKWAPGTRGWGYQKVVVRPTLDLRVVGFEEGKGKNAGGVGKVIVSYHGKEIGVGAGKMSYADREHVWRNQHLFVGRICCVEHKRDDSYTALREPTFQYWRDDKTEADA